MIVVALLVEYVQRILLEMEIRRRAGNWQKLFYGKNLPLYSVQLYTVATESICTLYSFVVGDT